MKVSAVGGIEMGRIVRMASWDAKHVGTRRIEALPAGKVLGAMG